PPRGAGGRTGRPARPARVALWPARPHCLRAGRPALWPAGAGSERARRATYASPTLVDEKGGHEEKGHHVGSGEERSNECVPKDGPYRSAAVGPQPSNGDEESRSGRTRGGRERAWAEIGGGDTDKKKHTGVRQTWHVMSQRFPQVQCHQGPPQTQNLQRQQRLLSPSYPACGRKQCRPLLGAPLRDRTSTPSRRLSRTTAPSPKKDRC
ncbi:unnamed protein product, partial [Prorocentrum cordatum]